jgi:ribosomal protein L11 methyltransferase
MPFWELRVPGSSDTSEGLTNFLWELGALGVVEEERSGAPPCLSAFFAETASPSSLGAAVARYCSSLAALGFSVPDVAPAVAPVLDQAWAEAWRRSFPPREIGRRLLVAPPWDFPAHPNGRQVLIIEPGRAFGTGTHESTRGCLLLLEALLETTSIPRALDLGTGSGILALAALRLGVGDVEAVDIDPDALREAWENARRNGVERRLACHLAGPEGLHGSFPLILANLLRESHVAFAPHYRRLLDPGGTLIAGGLLAVDEAAVMEALAAQGFLMVDRLDLDGWLSLTLSRSRNDR